jgi:hypothetical protein
VRERGSLSFDPQTQPLLLGNLYPKETAHLYYNYDVENVRSIEEISETLLEHIIIAYTSENESDPSDTADITASLKSYLPLCNAEENSLFLEKE